MQNKPIVTSAMLLLMTLALSSCGLFSSKSEYDRVPAGKALEVPPDLDEPSAASAVRIPNATYSRVANGPVSAGSPVGAAPTPAELGTRLEFAGGRQTLMVADSLESTWRRVGFALPRVGLEVQGQQRDSGVYSVEYVDVEAREQRPGRFSRWVMRKKGPTDYSGTYQVQLEQAGEQTRIRLLDERGARAAAAVTEVILTSLLERLE